MESVQGVYQEYVGSAQEVCVECVGSAWEVCAEDGWQWQKSAWEDKVVTPRTADNLHLECICASWVFARCPCVRCHV